MPRKRSLLSLEIMQNRDKFPWLYILRILFRARRQINPFGFTVIPRMFGCSFDPSVFRFVKPRQCLSQAFGRTAKWHIEKVIKRNYAGFTK
ncbi:hypothetical protein CDAR_56191 [Caerostris darwini]|uniref:Uncharacterized protein n=1 Tax=Caerostris darwini TaxID=1538125 RepID=A0AAV4RMM5_9ARAC|nr:hypothetical protein CDAR_56191 [Caerostris darwini]